MSVKCAGARWQFVIYGPRRADGSRNQILRRGFTSSAPPYRPKPKRVAG
jgi:hypothetical protein